MFLEIVIIILGFILLISGANLLVRGASNIAKKFHIPEMLIGLTIVALGTSMPELIVTITSASRGAGDLIIGDAVGSNLCNLLLILGSIAILRPIEIDKDAKKIHIPILFCTTMLVLLMGEGIFYGQAGVINKLDGFILIILSIIYFAYPIVSEIKEVKKVYKENKNNKTNSNRIFKSILFIALGAILLKYGGDFVVNHSINLAKTFNISEEIIGITIIAFGTSLPELATSILAVIRKDSDLAVGNLVGSCILNLLLILGAGAIIIPIKVSNNSIQNLVILSITNIVIWSFCLVGKKNKITRAKGVLLVIAFLLYMYIIL